jgi:hypothetical protein
MEARLSAVEGAISRLEARVSDLPTKAELRADIAESANGIIKWMVVTAVTLGVAAITVMTFVLNHASPKAPLPSQQPIIINVPAAPAAVAPGAGPPG